MKRIALFFLRGLLRIIVVAADLLTDLLVRAIWGFLLSLIVLSLGAGLAGGADWRDPAVITIACSACLVGGWLMALIGWFHDLLIASWIGKGLASREADIAARIAVSMETVTDPGRGARP